MSTETQIIEWGKAFRKELPDLKTKKLFDQYVRYKSNPKSGIPEDKVISKTDAIEEAVIYYSTRYGFSVPDKPCNGLSVSAVFDTNTALPDKPDKPETTSKDNVPESNVDMDKFVSGITTVAKPARKRAAKPEGGDTAAAGGAGKATAKATATAVALDAVIATDTSTAKAATPAKKRASRRKISDDEVETSPKVKAKPKKKAVIEAAPPPPVDIKPQSNLVATFLEKEMEALQVEDVEIIHLKNFEYDGKNFYRDERKGKIYQIGRNSIPGPYIGRWNNRSSAIETDIPDSDCERS